MADILDHRRCRQRSDRLGQRSLASWLRDLHCDLAQGYSFAKPSGSRLTALLFDSGTSWLVENEPGLPTF